MSIDKDKIKHTAKLARISLDENKIESLSKDLSNIFNFIEKLSKIKTDKINPLTSILDHHRLICSNFRLPEMLSINSWLPQPVLPPVRPLPVTPSSG